VETQVSQVESQRRQVDLAAAAVKGAQVALSYTTVRAPFSGVVVAQPAQEGEFTQPMSPGDSTHAGIATIVDMDSLEIEVDVSEEYIHRVQPGQPAEAVPDAYPQWRIPAHVAATIPTADRTKATFKVRIAIDEKDPRILPDMGMRISFLDRAPNKRARDPMLDSGAQGVLVPGSAIVARGEEMVVFTVDGGRARAYPVVQTQKFGDLEFVRGIASGVRVVNAPPPNMNDGARITVKQEQ
jgi:RND family efflux transporter MFP subunit